MLTFTDARARALDVAACSALSVEAVSAQGIDTTPVRKSGLRLDVYEASEVMLGQLGMGSRYDRRPMAELAKRAAALVQSSKHYAGAGPNDTVYRIGPITTQVYAVDWADSTCSARASGGDPEKLRALAEQIILARPEGFTRGISGPRPDDASSVLRPKRQGHPGRQHHHPRRDRETRDVRSVFHGVSLPQAIATLHGEPLASAPRDSVGVASIIALTVFTSRQRCRRIS